VDVHRVVDDALPCKESRDRRMNESSKRKRPSMLVVATAVLAVPAFGAGLLVGRPPAEAAPEQAVAASDELAERLPDDPVSIELAACQRKLARRMKTVSASSATGEPPKAPTDAGAPMGRIEVLQGEIKSCRRSELLHGAELCRSVRLHLDALLGLPKNDVLCVQRVRVADYIEDDFEKCAAFKSAPPDADLEPYTQEERKTILDAVEVAKTLDDEKLAELLNGVHQGCYGAPGANSP
jgi:hypothetical protein